MRCELVATKASSSVFGSSGDVAEAARHPPHRRDHRADAEAAEQHVARCGLRRAQRPRPPARRRSAGPAAARRAARPAPVAAASSVGRSCPRRAASSATLVDRGHARPPPVMPRSVANAARPSTRSTTSDFRLPPPMRTSVLLPQPEASTMPKPNIRPPTTSDSQISRGAGVDATWPASTQPSATMRVEAEHRGADRQHPHAHARPVADGDDVGHRAHGAEVRALRDGAERDARARTRPTARVARRPRCRSLAWAKL